LAMRQTTRSQIDSVLKFIIDHDDDIAIAHSKLGVPLDECICSAVKRALQVWNIAQDDQPTLFSNKEGEQS